MSETIGTLAAGRRRRPYYASCDRAGAHPERHLHGFCGILQADAYSGYNRLYDAGRPQGAITPALCWAHARRQFFELADIATNPRRGKNAVVISPIALEAVRRIDALFEIGCRTKRATMCREWPNTSENSQMMRVM